MQIKNLGDDYLTVTGGLLKNGQTTNVSKWEYDLMVKLGAKLEIVESFAEESKTVVKTEPVKKKKK